MTTLIRTLARTATFLASAASGAAVGGVIGTVIVLAVMDMTGGGCDAIGGVASGPCPDAVGLFALVAGELPGVLAGGVVGMAAVAVVLAGRDLRHAGESAAK